MNTRWPNARPQPGGVRAVLTLAALAALFFSLAADGLAQRSFSHRYPARKNVRLELKNLFGTITVNTWERDEIKVNADLDTPAARFTPEQSADGLVINVVRDNSSKRGEVGDVNFTITVPVNSIVDLETKRGQIKVNGVQGSFVRAHVSSEGDIELVGIRADTVMASNTVGNIFFDGELVSGGTYEFKSWQGDISIRIPGNSDFNLTASAPQSRSILLGDFGGAGLSFIGDGRKVVGNVGDGRAKLTINNYRGKITFIRR